MSQTSWQHELLSDTCTHTAHTLAHNKEMTCLRAAAAEERNGEWENEKSQLHSACIIHVCCVLYVYIHNHNSKNKHLKSDNWQNTPPIGRNGCDFAHASVFRFLEVEIIAVPFGLIVCVSFVHLLPHQHSIHTHTHAIRTALFPLVSPHCVLQAENSVIETGSSQNSVDTTEHEMVKLRKSVVMVVVCVRVCMWNWVDFSDLS